MPVLLRTSRDLPARPSYRWWFRIPGDHDGAAAPDADAALSGLPTLLEQAFDDSAADWWALGRALGQDASSRTAHAPVCSPNASDLGLMLAWTRIVQQKAAEADHTLVLCDDPWMFRHLGGIANVVAGRAPGLFAAAAWLYGRGVLSRCQTALRYAVWSMQLGRQPQAPENAGWLMVYGHPSSTPDGIDGYFGRLMQDMPALRRVLHVDCPPGRAAELASDGRTVSLHGFGHPAFALTLPFRRWRPAAIHRRGAYGSLVRRAVAREGGTGTAAAIAWQRHCQARWLRQTRPSAVAWPWENHAWERALVRTARTLGIRTNGYQHSVIGRQMLNYAPASNPDGEASLPDRIICNGPATYDHLVGWNVPRERLVIGGALRFVGQAKPKKESTAPIFLALPFDSVTATEMVDAARTAAREGFRFVVKDHPMFPFAFTDTAGVERTTGQLSAQPAVSAVIYAATTVGLEAILAGIPTLRFRPRAKIAIDILPHGVTAPAVEAETMIEVLRNMSDPAMVAPTDIFAPVDLTVWRQALETV
jgi:hypothetical protein